MKLGIVGAGQSAIVLAHALRETGIQISLIEAGDFQNESTFLNRDNFRFKTESSMPDGVHLVGGGGNKWYGRVSKFPNYVFDGVNSSWPIKSQDLARYYEEVYRLVGIEGVDENQIEEIYEGDLSSKLQPYLKLSPYFRCNPLYFERLIDELKTYENIEFVLSTPIEFLTIAEDGKVIAKDFQENEFIFDVVVVAGGTFQSTALLLRSLPFLSLVENTNLIGRSLMEHFDGYVGSMRVKKWELPKVKGLVGGSRPKGLRANNDIPGYGYGIKLDDTFYRDTDSQILDFHLHFEPYQEVYTFGDLYFLISKKSIIKRILFSIELVVRKFFVIPLRTLIDSQFNYERFSIYLKGEELPFFDSRMRIVESLSAYSDTIECDHSISRSTTLGIRMSLKIFKSVFQNYNFGKIKFFWWFMHKPRVSYTGPNWHPMGTMPLNVDPSKRVVNSDLSLTGYPTIYMLNAGVFPSGSYQNPTTTVLALAIRLSEKLSMDFKSKRPDAGEIFD